jgi:hypothetical protein
MPSAAVNALIVDLTELIGRGSAEEIRKGSALQEFVRIPTGAVSNRIVMGWIGRQGPAFIRFGPSAS